MKFDITKPIDKDFKYYMRYANIIFVFLVVVCFAVFAFYSNITNILFNKNKMDIFKEDLQEVAFYFWTIDEDVSKMLLNVDDIVKGYMSGENVLVSKKQEILDTLQYVKMNQHYLASLWFQKYEWFISLLSDLQSNWDEVSTLLGEKWEFNYLVILQNANEKRPNGWFFGSFAFITVKDWRLENLEIVDAYYPDYIAAHTRLMAPQWAWAFLPDLKIWFIAWNKFWFSDIDGSNLKWLYEKMFNEEYDMSKVQQTMVPGLYEKLLNKYIKGIIFIRSDLIEFLIPSFKEKAWEWQFQNANVDIIRWEERGNKKETYIQEVTNYFREHSIELFQQIINNFDEIVEKNYVNIYLSNVSSNLQNVLLNHGLKTVYDSWYIYAWDTNTSFNKVDDFVTKNIQIIDSNGKIVIDESNDIVDIKSLPKWEYIMKIYYTLNVPNNYIDFMHKLEAKYGIQMTDRELWILAMKPEKYEDTPYPKWMETKATVYFPLNFEISSVKWDQLEDKLFYAPFSNGVYYKMLINTNNTTKSIEMKLINN